MVKKQRVDKVLSNMGLGTRKDVKQLVKQGKVVVNDKRTYDPGIQVDPVNDKIEVNGKQVIYKEFAYYMLNKPQNVVSATEDNRDQTVVDLLEKQDRVVQVFPVGRLDKDTEGLLLLTNDGQLAHELLSPKKHIPKTYYAKIEGKVTEVDCQAFEKGVVLED
jgi:16S rRNA pseudouridine516 synthase